jgi:hypothetical protein
MQPGRSSGRPRLVQQRRRDQQPAAHPAAKPIDLRGPAVAEVGEPQSLFDRRPPLRPAHPVQVREYKQVLLDRQRHVEVVELWDHAHLCAGLLGIFRQPIAEDLDLARVGDHLRRQRLHRGRLAGAIGPEQPDAPSHRDFEVEAVDRDERAEPLDDAAQRDRVVLQPGHDPNIGFGRWLPSARPSLTVYGNRRSRARCRR